MKPNAQRAKNAITSLYAIMIGLVVTTLSAVLLLYKISEATQGYILVNPDEILMYSMIVGIIALLQIVVYVLCIVFFIMWFRRAYFNLHRLVPSHRLKYSEGWAAGAWFVPIFSLFGPYQIATDLFYESEKLLVEHGLMEKKPKFHQVKGWWWTLWIASIVLNQLSRIGDDSREFMMTSIISVVIMLITIGAGLLAIQMIKNYSKMEVLLKQIPLTDTASPAINITNDDLLDSGI